MLDRRTSALLQTINDFCASGTYKVFSSEDFLASFPEKWGVTSESLTQMLGYLSENGYINIKYSGSGMYCICPLPLGRSYCEREAEKRTNARCRSAILSALRFSARLRAPCWGRSRLLC